MKTFLEPLTPDEEKIYIEKMRLGDKKAKDILIERNLRLVAHVVKKYYDENRENQDLISIGIVGLIKAVNTYNPDKGNRLVTYAAKCIENELLMMLRAEKKRSKDVSLNEPIGTAIKNSGFMIPPKRITINFSPANIRKTGTYFDQPVAVSILPDMTLEEQIEISKIQSVAGNLSESLVKTRPVRSPHHTATVSAMIRGGFNSKPGEITQTHEGILFLDELPEFSRQVIETLRQPLEDEKIIVSRSGGTYEFPAKFILIGAMKI